MKRTKIFTILLLIVVIVSLILTIAIKFNNPFFKNEAPYELLESFQYHFIAILPTKNSFNDDLLKVGLNKASTEYNSFTEVYEVETGQEQIELMEIAIRAKVDGIIVYPIQSKNIDKYIELINVAAEKKIPVITVGYDIPQSRRFSYIGSTEVSAKTIAYELLNITKAKGKVAIIITEDDFEYNVMTINAIEEILNSYGDLSLSVNKIDRNFYTGQTQVKMILDDSPDLVLNLSPDSVYQVIKTVEESRKDIPIFVYSDSYDVFNLVANKKINGLFLNKGEYIGYLTIKYLRSKIQEKWVPERLDPGLILINSKNIKNYINDEEFAK
ncbi:substrate-binding domain-containing protein [Petroclostridium sp. X23]|uniref:sugar ABC transporter substrate-binding protein n=1 Tax=Petroclostridium sp. X23 TaxID=3045146 RepID=UPI0024AD55E4|nr:substrate-binding domain-containing protein [Petroclostridium sp. X23]WHH60891.1 substrate-binding domain-containing protein [Petroclostridium sp. X23]